MYYNSNISTSGFLNIPESVRDSLKQFFNKSVKKNILNIILQFTSFKCNFY